MAVDQATTHPDLFKYLLTVNNNNNYPVQIGNNLPYYSDVSNHGVGGGFMPVPVNECSYVLPYYDVAFNTVAGRCPPAAKDDSGVTFNNSFVRPTVTPSKKRQRETAVLPAVPISGGSLAVNPFASTCGSKKSNSFSFLGEDISLQIMNQQIEIGRLISHHISKMKVEVEDRKKHQLRRIMAAVENVMTKKMREKDEQINRIGKINFELEERVNTLCLENQLWKDLAQSNEATANALRTNLEHVLNQMRENAERAAAGEMTDDAVSCCGSSGDSDEREIDGGEQSQKRMNSTDGEDGKKWIYRGEMNRKLLCRKCGEDEINVLLLPCRHLCLCTSCGPTVNTCPICNAVKDASVHVYLS